MKIINSPVRPLNDRLTCDRRASPSNAAIKKIAHKQQRARLGEVTRRQMDIEVQESLYLLEEKELQIRQAAEAYKWLLAKVMATRPSQRRSNGKRVEYSQNRLEVRIQSSESVISVLASCAMID